MRNTHFTRRSSRCALLRVLTLAVLVMLTAGLSSLAAAQDWETDDWETDDWETDDWPPDLSEAYPDWKPGDKLIKPIQPHVMKQTTAAVLKLAESVFAHVDEFIEESKQVQSTDMLENHVAFYRPSIFRTYGEYPPILDLLDEAGDAGKGISSISLVHEEMQRKRDKVRAIAKRYENPIEIPHEPNALQAFLTKQTGEAKAIHTTVAWLMHGRHYAVQWVLDSLYRPDEIMQYHGRVRKILEPKIDEIAARDPIYRSLDRLDTLERHKRWYAIFKEHVEPFAADEKRLIDQYVARHLRLRQLTWLLLEQVHAQLDQFVAATPSEWGEIPFCQDLFYPVGFTYSTEERSYAARR